MMNSEINQQRFAEESVVLGEIGRIIGSSLDIQDVYERFAEEARKLIAFDRIVICTVDLENGTYTVAYRLDDDVPGRRRGETAPLAGSHTEVVALAQGSPLIQTECGQWLAEHFPGLSPFFEAGFRSFLAVRLISRDDVVGVMHLHSKVTSAYTHADVAMMERVGTRIASAVANAQLHARLASEAREREALAEIGRIISSSLDIDDIYERFAEEVRKLLVFDRIGISTVDLRNGTFTLAHVLGADVPGRRAGDTASIDGTLTKAVALARSAMLVQEEDIDILGDQFPALLPAYEAGVRSFLTVPLISKDQVVAILGVGSKTPNAYTDADVGLAVRVGAQIAGAVANARLHAELEREAREGEVLAEIGRIIGSSLDIEEVYQQFAEKLNRLVAFDGISINTVDLEKGTSSVAYLLGHDVPGRRREDTSTLTGTQTEVVLRAANSLRIQSKSKEWITEHFPGLGPFFEAGFRSFLAVRLDSKDKVVGVLHLYSKNPNAYTDADNTLLERVGTQIAGAIANAQLHTQLERQSREREVLAEIGRIINSSLEIDEVYERFTEEVRNLFAFDRVAISTDDSESGTFTTAYVVGPNVPGRSRGETMALAGTHTQWVLQSRSAWLFQTEDKDLLLEQFPSLSPGFDVGIRSFLTVPLISKEQIVGVLHVRSMAPNSYTESDVALAERVGTQIAGAIANSQLHAQLERQSREREVLAEIGRIINSSLEIDDVYDRFAAEVRKLFAFDRLVISTVEPEHQTLRIAHVIGTEFLNRQRGDRFPLAGTHTDTMITDRAPKCIQIENVDEALERYPGLSLAWEAGLRSFLGVPIILEGQVIGALHLHSKTPSAYIEADVALAERVGTQIAGAIANAQLHAQLEQEYHESAVLAEIERIINSSLEIDEVYEQFAEAVRGLFAFDRIVISTVDVESSTFTTAYVLGHDLPGRPAGETVPLSGTHTENVVRALSAVLVQSEGADLLRVQLPVLSRDFEIESRSLLSVPLISKEQVVGVLHLRSKTPNAYSEADLDLAERIGAQIASAIANARQYEEQKRADEQLRLQATALEAAVTAISITDTNGTIIWVNGAFTTLTGFTAEEAVGQTHALIKSGEHGLEFFRELWSTIISGDVWRGEITNRRKDGSVYAEEQTITPVRNGEGAIINYVAIKQDITERKELQNQLVQAQKMEAVGQLTGGIAHDFNNLLTPVLGYASLAGTKVGSDQVLGGYFREIEKAAERAATLIRQLLTFSRRQVVEAKPTRLDELILSTDQFLRRLIGEDIELVCLPSSEMMMVSVDPGQLEQVIINLAVNARDAMPGGGKLTIETANMTLDTDTAQSFSELEPGDYIRLSVSDTGVGMDEKVKARIFEPFYTTKGPGKGTGLGLATCYAIVRQSGGAIRVYSEPGQGTSFEVYLPRLLETEGAQLTRERDPEPLPVGTETVLLVEDEPSVRRLAAEVLGRQGYAVVQAATVEHALRIADGADLLLTDVVMPGMSGRELAERLQVRVPNLKVLYTSGYADDTIVEHGLHTSSLHFLPKPFTREMLPRKVRETLDST